MASNDHDLQQFRKLRAQAAQKKQLEARRAELLPQCRDLAAQAEARKKERLDAEKELAGLESRGPLGLLYTIAGGKAQRLEAAQKTLQLAERSEQFRDFSTTELLQYTAAQTIQCHQTLEQGLNGLLAQAEEARLRLEEAQDDLLAQEFPSI